MISARGCGVRVVVIDKVVQRLHHCQHCGARHLELQYGRQHYVAVQPARRRSG